MLSLAPVKITLEKAKAEICAEIRPLKEKVDQLERKPDLTPAEENALDKLSESIDTLEEKQDRIDQALNLLINYK